MTVSTISGFGVPELLLRYVNYFSSDDKPGGAQPRELKLIFLGSSAFAAAAILLYADVISIQESKEDPWIWVATSFLFLSYTFAVVTNSSARGRENHPEIARMTLFGCLFQLPGVIFGALLLGPVGGILGHTLRYLPQALLYRRYARAPEPGKSALSQNMKSYARNNWFSSVLGLLIWTRLEFLFLGLYQSATVLGYYAVALSLSGLVVQLPTQMLVGLVPFLGRHHDNQDLDQLKRTTQRVTRWLCFLAFPICLGGAAVAGDLIPLLFGSEFEPAVTIGAILLGTSFITPLTQIPSALISGRERSDFFVKATPVVAVFSVALLAAVVPFYGGEGAAVARSIVHLSWLIVLAWFSSRRLSIQMFTADVFKLFAAAVLCAATAYAVLQVIPGLPGLFLAVAAGAGAYLLATRVLGALPEEDANAMMQNIPASVPGPVVKTARRCLQWIAVGSHHR